MTVFLEDEEHVALVRWWRERDEAPAALVHVDLHHDLGADAREGMVGSGDVVRAGIREGRLREVAWVVPFERRALAGEVGAALLATLPADVRARVEPAGPGRWRAELDDVPIEIRGADDLPGMPTGRAEVEISLDLDFLYHPAVGGPAVHPVRFVERFLRWRRRVHPRATFVATGFGAGYTPPTYTPVATWLRTALRRDAIPAGSTECWRHVLRRERRRLGFAAPEDDAGTLGAVWGAYLGRRWDELPELLPQLPADQRFHPREELLVELQAGRRASAVMGERVGDAVRALGDAWLPRKAA